MMAPHFRCYCVKTSRIDLFDKLIWWQFPKIGIFDFRGLINLIKTDKVWIDRSHFYFDPINVFFSQWHLTSKSKTIDRLNSGNFWIFEHSEWNLNLECSDYRASNIIFDDAKLEPISSELNVEIPLLSICVDVWLGEHHPTNVSYESKDALENFTIFDEHDIPVTGRGKTSI